MHTRTTSYKDVLTIMNIRNVILHQSQLTPSRNAQQTCKSSSKISGIQFGGNLSVCVCMYVHFSRDINTSANQKVLHTNTAAHRRDSRISSHL